MGVKNVKKDRENEQERSKNVLSKLFSSHDKWKELVIGFGAKKV